MADKNSAVRSVGLQTRDAVARAASALFGESDWERRTGQALRVGARDFVGGLLGNDSNSVAAALTAPRASGSLVPKGDGSVTVALPKARAATVDDSPLTPQERQLAFVDSMFRKPLTLRQAVAVTGIMPQTAKPPTKKDLFIDDTAKISQALLQQQIAAASSGGEMTAEQKLGIKALNDEYNRRVALIGGNPNNAAQAGMFGAFGQGGE